MSTFTAFLLGVLFGLFALSALLLLGLWLMSEWELDAEASRPPGTHTHGIERPDA